MWNALNRNVNCNQLPSMLWNTGEQLSWKIQTNWKQVFFKLKKDLFALPVGLSGQGSPKKSNMRGSFQNLSIRPLCSWVRQSHREKSVGKKVSVLWRHTEKSKRWLYTGCEIWKKRYCMPLQTKMKEIIKLQCVCKEKQLKRKGKKEVGKEPSPEGKKKKT